MVMGYSYVMADDNTPDFEQDDEFPAVNDDTLGTVFTASNGTVWVCEVVSDGVETVIGWRFIGRSDR